MKIVMAEKEHADDIIHARSGLSVQNHKYIYKEKLSNGTWRYYYKQPEVKGPRANARISGSRYGNYATKDGNHTLEYNKTKKSGGYTISSVGGEDYETTWSHTVIDEGNWDRAIEKGKNWLKDLFRK